MWTVNYPLPSFLCLLAAQSYCNYSKNNRDVNQRVRGKAFSDKMRLLFNAGLEGTGHHYIDNPLHGMFQKHKDISPLNLCQDFVWAFFLDPSMTRNASHYVEIKQNARTSRQHLALFAESVSSTFGRLATFQGRSALTSWKAEELSYPNLAAQKKHYTMCWPSDTCRLCRGRRCRTTGGVS